VLLLLRLRLRNLCMLQVLCALRGGANVQYT
jgi:hypothetical protein